MKKWTLMTLVMAFLVAILSPWSYSQTVADNTKLGSLLVYPKVLTKYGFDTLIMMTNDSNTAVNVKCYWEIYDGSSCENMDFQFKLTPKHAISFWASDGTTDTTKPGAGFSALGDNALAALKCWAVNASATQQISHNFLKGEAIITDYTGESGESAAQHNAWRYAANASRGTFMGTPGEIILSGAPGAYDASPNYLIGHFISETDNATNVLTLVPMIENLKQEGFDTTTKATFTIWNENEVKFTGAHQCYTCLLDKDLSDIKIGTRSMFDRTRLKTDYGRFRVQSAFSRLCTGSFRPTGVVPAVGTLAQKIVTDKGNRVADWVSTNLTTAGKNTLGYVYWDPGYDAEEKPKQ